MHTSYLATWGQINPLLRLNVSIFKIKIYFINIHQPGFQKIKHNRQVLLYSTGETEMIIHIPSPLNVFIVIHAWKTIKQKEDTVRLRVEEAPLRR